MDGGDSTEEDQVMSEVHLGCPPHSTGPHITRFTISLPPEVEPCRFNELFKAEGAAVHEFMVDEDGDLVLPRRRKNFNQCFNVTIRHNVTSSIPSVGLQVWKAELVLSDFVMHKMCTSSEFDGIVSLELGAGTGLVGLLLGHVAQKVFLTDHGDEILDNCAQNIKLNCGVLHCQGAVHVRELDWMKPWPPGIILGNSASQKSYSWNSSELEEVQRASLLVAADVIYSDDLTDAFFSILERLMLLGSEKVLYLALEKRYNFSLNDLDVVANGYSRFISYVREQGGKYITVPSVPIALNSPVKFFGLRCGYVIDNAEYESLEDGLLPCFVGKCIDLNEIPQYVRDYDRGSDVELWQIKYNKRKF